MSNIRDFFQAPGHGGPPDYNGFNHLDHKYFVNCCCHRTHAIVSAKIFCCILIGSLIIDISTSIGELDLFSIGSYIVQLIFATMLFIGVSKNAFNYVGICLIWLIMGLVFCIIGIPLGIFLAYTESEKGEQLWNIFYFRHVYIEKEGHNQTERAVYFTVLMSILSLIRAYYVYIVFIAFKYVRDYEAVHNMDEEKLDELFP